MRRGFSYKTLEGCHKSVSWLVIFGRSVTSVDVWTTMAHISSGRIFRCVNKTGSVWGSGISETVVWSAVKEFAARVGIEQLAPHDLRRTCARLCHLAGGELEQIQFLLGHVSVQTTERY